MRGPRLLTTRARRSRLPLTLALAAGVLVGAAPAFGHPLVTGIAISKVEVNGSVLDLDVDLYKSSTMAPTTVTWMGDYVRRSQATPSGASTVSASYLLTPSIPAVDFGDGSVVPRTTVTSVVAPGTPNVWRKSFSHTYALPGPYEVRVGTWVGTIFSPATFSPDAGSPVPGLPLRWGGVRAALPRQGRGRRGRTHGSGAPGDRRAPLPDPRTRAAAPPPGPRRRSRGSRDGERRGGGGRAGAARPGGGAGSGRPRPLPGQAPGAEPGGGGRRLPRRPAAAARGEAIPRKAATPTLRGAAPPRPATRTAGS